MIEKTILDYLKTILTCEVVLERDGQTAPFVLFERTSSSRTNYMNTASIAFQSYGESMYKAAELNEEVINAVFSLPELDSVSGVRLTNSYDFTDTSTKEYRYQAVFDIYYYMEA